jgi:hypothetical protein
LTQRYGLPQDELKVAWRGQLGEPLAITSLPS